MAKKSKKAKAKGKKLTPEEAAEKAKPKWRAVKPDKTQGTGAGADGSSPELNKLQERYLGKATTSDSVDKKERDLDIVVMEERDPKDARAGRKAVIMDDGKIIGEQG